VRRGLSRTGLLLWEPLAAVPMPPALAIPTGGRIDCGHSSPSAVRLADMRTIQRCRPGPRRRARAIELALAGGRCAPALISWSSAGSRSSPPRSTPTGHHRTCREEPLRERVSRSATTTADHDWGMAPCRPRSRCSSTRRTSSLGLPDPCPQWPVGGPGGLNGLRCAVSTAAGLAVRDLGRLAPSQRAPDGTAPRNPVESASKKSGDPCRTGRRTKAAAVAPARAARPTGPEDWNRGRCRSTWARPPTAGSCRDPRAARRPGRRGHSRPPVPWTGR
jgi:hypothetical protein